MPIANVFLRPDHPGLSGGLGDVTALWADAAGVSADHMTVNLVPLSGQEGVRFDAVAVLYLPTVWSSDQVGALQLGLTNALAAALGLSRSAIQVVVSMIQSGHATTGSTVEIW
ncbi:MAG: hypothetical protein AAF408_08425 [Pseudomonadota bacterium]